MDALDTSSAFLTSSTNGEELKNSLMPNQYFYPYDNEDLKQSNKNAENKNNPPSHLRDALVKEEEENSGDNVEKPPKRRKTSNKREIIRPDPKYKGLFKNQFKNQFFVHLLNLKS